MDVKRLIGEVAARHGVRLDADDPALVLVTISELVLQEAREEFIGAVRHATAEFVQAAGCVQDQAGAALAKQVRTAGAEWRNELERVLGSASSPHQGARETAEPSYHGFISKRMLGHSAIGLMLFVAGMIVGRMVL